MYQGVKLKLQSRIGTLEIGNGEFLVLVPFTKKDNTSQTTRTQNSNHSKTSMQVPNQPSISKFADSAWSDMMQDLSYLGDTSVSKAPELKIGSFNLRDRRDALAGTASSWSSEAKRKRGIDCDDLLYDVLCLNVSHLIFAF